MAFSAKNVEELKKPLDRSRIVTKTFPGKGQLSYLEGYDVIDKANAVFGFGSWDYRVSRPAEWNGKVWVAYVVVRVRAGDEVAEREDVGIGIPATGQGKEPSPDATETAMKGAVTDALKRGLRTFGNAFGLSLYDKTDPTGVHSNAAQPEGDAPPAITQPAATTASAPTPIKPNGTSHRTPTTQPAKAAPVAATAKPDAKALWNTLLEEAQKKGYAKEDMQGWSKEHVKAVFGKASLGDLTAQEWDALIGEIKQAPGAASPTDAGGAF